MTIETWIKESNNDYCFIGKNTYCCNCMNGDHHNCIITQDYEDQSFSCECDCEVGI